MHRYAVLKLKGFECRCAAEGNSRRSGVAFRGADSGNLHAARPTISAVHGARPVRSQSHLAGAHCLHSLMYLFVLFATFVETRARSHEPRAALVTCTGLALVTLLQSI